MNISLERYLALDVETTIETFQKLRVISVKEFDKPAEIVYRYDVHGEEVPKSLKSYIESFDGVIVHYSWFDLPLLNKLGIFPKAVFDTHLAETMIKGDENHVSMGLKQTVAAYCNVSLDKELQVSDWGQPLTEEQLNYAKEDVYYLHDVATQQLDTLLKQGQFFEFYMRCETINVWALDVWEGIPIDEKKKNELLQLALAEKAKQHIYLLGKLPISACIPSNISYKDIKELILKAKGYNGAVEVLEGKTLTKTRYKNVAGLRAMYDFESLREYFINNPLDPILLDLGGAVPTRILLNQLGIHGTMGKKGESVNKNFLKEVYETATGELKEVLDSIMKLRKAALIYTRYCKGEDDQMAEYAGGMRVKPKVSYTVTGRISLVPFSTLPREDEDKDPLENEVHKMYHAPAGYKLLSLDYASQESVAVACLYRDKQKLKYVKQKYDPYLLLASKLFPELEYNDPSQTKELKKLHKAARQVGKAGELARGYVCGTAKFHAVMSEVATKFGIDFPYTPDEAMLKWGELYPNLLWAQNHTSKMITEGIQSYYQEVDDKMEYWAKQSGFTDTNDFKKRDTAIKANGIRGNFLLKEGAVLVNRSITGLAKITPLHKKYKMINTFSKKCKITDVFNYPIQSSCASVLFLAVLLVKDFFPSIIIPATIHDSLICFVPDALVEKYGEDGIQEAVNVLMRKAFWIVFGSNVEVDGAFTEIGLK